MRKRSTVLSLVLTGSMLGAALLSGCSSEADSQGKTVIELVQYKPEAVEVFEQLEEKFNATHDDILLKIDSPNDAMTILKTKSGYHWNRRRYELFSVYGFQYSGGCFRL